MKNIVILSVLAVVIYIWYERSKPVAPLTKPLPEPPTETVPGALTEKDGFVYQDGKVVGSMFAPQYRVPKTILSTTIANGS